MPNTHFDVMVAAVADRFRTDMAAFNELDETYREELRHVDTMLEAVIPDAPLVVLTPADKAEMARVDVASIRSALKGASDDEIFLAWRNHSRCHLGSPWAKVDGTAVTLAHVASAVHVLRMAVAREQRALPKAA